MNYNVVWEESSYEELETMLDSGVPARLLLVAVRQVLEILSHDPYDAGRELAEELRIIDVSPLRAYFFIEALEGTVKITFIRWIG
jgi:hypothetical protein